MSEYIANTSFRALKQARLHQSSNPQLAVCLGLLEHAMQSSLGLPSIFQDRRSRCSLGIACRVRYTTSSLKSSVKDRQQLAKKEGKITQDAQGQRWLNDYVDWFVQWVRKTLLGIKTSISVVSDLENRVTRFQRASRSSTRTALTSVLMSNNLRDVPQSRL